MSTTPVKLSISPDLVLCTACGTQYPVRENEGKTACRICDDPRQFVPPQGQTFTTLAQLQQGHHNVWWKDRRHPHIWSVRVEPRFAVGQRAEIIQTPKGNILWDLIPLLDQETVDKIVELGGLQAIVISHPHYYSTWADWSRTFKCPVYVGMPDKQWLERTDVEGTDVRFLEDTYTPIAVAGEDIGLNAILAGGHFPGSLLLHYQNLLFIADTIVTSPSATNPVPGKPGVVTFTFFWSIANRIPLQPDEFFMIWEKVKQLEFDTCFGAFEGMDVYTMDNEHARKTGGVKGRLLESCKIFAKAMGWTKHAIFEETL